jgi:hypothetical protein
MDAPSLTTIPFSLGFGSGGEDEVAARLRIPVFSEEKRETLFENLVSCGHELGFDLYDSNDWLVGLRIEPVATRLGECSEAIYGDLQTVARRRNRALARIWNYVPRINESSPAGLEAYRVFCRGRSLAFERGGWRGPVPAASAVGGPTGVLAVMFAASRGRPVMRENPEQVPAYRYPPDYGPRPPSFSRAAQVEADGRRWTLLSGTASIKGHRTVAAGDLRAQIACTLDNLRLISRECGLGEELAARAPGVERHFKVYLRREADLAKARASLDGALFMPTDRVLWLHSDICRAELLIEIEATIIEPRA